jgi:hypothetical protein
LPSNPITPVLVGYAFLGILSQWFLLGGAINFFVLQVLIIGVVAAIWRYRYYYQSHSANILRWLRAMPAKQIAVLLTMLGIILYQSALPTKIHDMGAYYLQTLQWMQKFGAVRGLANLYPALGLGSAWHSLLCIFQLPGLPPFYALNGTLIFTIFLWLFFQFLAQPKHPNQNAIIAMPKLQKIYLTAYGILLFPLAFLYLTAPSPDLPLLVFTPLLLYFLVLDTNSLNPAISLLIACFLFAIKPPALLAIGLGALAVLHSFEIFKPQTLSQKIITTRKSWLQKIKLFAFKLTLIIFFLAPVIGKNWLQTGYPLYPMGNIALHFGVQMEAPKWQVPADWNQAYRSGIIAWGYSDKPQLQEFKGQLPSTLSRLLLWLNRIGYKGFINKLLFINVLLGFILCLVKIPTRFRLSILLLVSVQIVEYFFLSQYRLMLPTALTLFGLNFIGIGFWLLAPGRWPLGGSRGYRFSFGSRGSLILRGVLLLLVSIYFVLAFVPMSIFKSASRNKSITQTEGFQTTYLLKAYTQYQDGVLDSSFIDGMAFHFYNNKNYTWNAPIPAQSISHTRFLSNNFGYQIKPLGKSPGDGFFMSRD